jgi:hypothetical protein
VLSGDAVGHEEDYISCWKYPLVGKDSTVDDISADEELEAVNAARQMLGLSPLETLGENDDTDNSDIGDNIDNSDNIDNIDNSDNAE